MAAYIDQCRRAVPAGRQRSNGGGSRRNGIPSATRTTTIPFGRAAGDWPTTPASVHALAVPQRKTALHLPHESGFTNQALVLCSFSR